MDRWINVPIEGDDGKEEGLVRRGWRGLTLPCSNASTYSINVCDVGAQAGGYAVR